MQPYHKFVFDSEKRVFIGDFEGMYSAEDKEGFDSWFQDDTNHLGRQMALLLINRYSFRSILDIGCGKGAFTNLLKKKNNQVQGADISENAIIKAKARYGDIAFIKATAKEILETNNRWELITIIEVLSYLEDWKEVVSQAAMKCDYFLVSLYLPFNPIGFVKSFDDLKAEIRKHFTITEEIMLNQETILLMAKKKIAKDRI